MKLIADDFGYQDSGLAVGTDNFFDVDNAVIGRVGQRHILDGSCVFTGEALQTSRGFSVQPKGGLEGYIRLLKIEK